MSTLEGHTNGVAAWPSIPPARCLPAATCQEQLRLWDSVLGRPLLNLKSDFGPEFSQDGRIVVGVEDQLTAYQVEPALEYRTFAHPSREPIDYARPSVRHDGRVLAVGTDSGAVLWDLARGTELAFLPIASAWHLMFEPSGDLITSGSMGVHRWPIRLDAGRREFRYRPAASAQACRRVHCGIAEDRSGRIVVKADRTYAYVATAERTIRVGRLNDCRSVAVSPDGQWLATGTHSDVSRRRADLAHQRRQKRGRSAHRVSHRGRLQPGRKMAADRRLSLPALGSRHLARGEAVGRPGSLLLPRRPAWWWSRTRAT